MIRTKNILTSAIVAIGFAGLTISDHVFAQTGSYRKELQRHDLSVPGREVLQVVVTIGQGESFPRHKHPGEEIIYVLEGSLQYEVEDKPPVTLQAGGVLFIPNGKIHAAKNVGSGNAIELATYIVEKGKPLIEIAK